jgi:hypothetical protein
MSANGTAAEAIERLALYFGVTPTRQGILARHALGQPAPGDGALALQLSAGLRAEALLNGASPGAVVPAVWRVHEMMDLGYEVDREEAAGLMGWMLQLQSKPGAFSVGCSRARHAHRVCEHFISGFFSPAPAEERLAPIMLPNGKVFRAEPAARFAFSCLALRAAVRTGLQTTPSVEQHFNSLLHLQDQWENWNGYLSPDAIVAGIHALALVPTTPDGVLSRLAASVAANQASDGTWANADLFHTVEAMVAVGTAAAHATVRRAVPAILARQRADGSFGPTAQQERALIALRALLFADREM